MHHKFTKAAVALSGAMALIGSTGLVAANAAVKHSPASVIANAEKQLAVFEKAFPAGSSLTEAGSSLVYPLMQSWEKGPGIGTAISPAAGGSGAGQSGAENGTINIGGSDPYLPASTLASTGVLNVPVAVAAQLVNYNIPGLATSKHVKLNGTILSEMYSGQITMWNDPAITAINPGVSIPAIKVVPIHRSDSSGDTFLFTTYLNAQDPSGVAASGPTQLESWPNVSGSIAESGNGGMAAGCVATPGCVAYIGISYERTTTASGLGNAALLSGYAKAKQYIVANKNSINNEVASFKNIPASGGISLINSHTAKSAYPIVNFEYAIVKQTSSKTAAIKGFLAWAMDPKGGSTTAFLAPVNFLPLPSNALKVSTALLASMS